MIKTIIGVILLTSIVVVAQPVTKPIVVAVIDTGIAKEAFGKHILCQYGHRDFTGTGIIDNHGHGTHISTLIDQYVKDVHPYSEQDTVFKAVLSSVEPHYCQVILKYFNKEESGADNMKAMIGALRWAIDIKVDVINIAGGGSEPNPQEETLIKEALNKGITIVAAAGNEGYELDQYPATSMEWDSTKIHNYYFPAGYDRRIVMVGNWTEKKLIAKTSNRGSSVNAWEIGTQVLSLCQDWNYCRMSGTSQATAIRTGKIVRKMLHLK
jgi:subtilisin family serine protease